MRQVNNMFKNWDPYIATIILILDCPITIENVVE